MRRLRIGRSLWRSRRGGSAELIRFDFLRDPTPSFVDSLRRVRLPRRLYPAALAGAAVIAALAAASGAEVFREHAAQALEERAGARFERSRAALTRARLQWQRLDGLVALDRRLRQIRTSGSVAAQRIARVGNAFPQRAWVTSMAAGAASAYEVKGFADGLPAVEKLLANVARDRVAGRPRLLQVSQSGGQPATTLGFELELVDAR